MDWLIDLFAKPSVGQQVLALSFTAAVGIMLGKVKVKGISLGGAVGFGMMKAGDVLLMALYVGASVIIGILAVWGGMMLSNISIRG